MRSRLPEWLRPTRKGIIDNAYFTAGAAVLSALASGIGTWLSAPASDREMVFLFLGILLTLSVSWFLIAIGAAVWRRTKDRDVPTASVTGAVAPPQNESIKKPPVEFLVEGGWLNTPFRFSNIGMNDRHQTIYCEDAYVTLMANEFLDSVRVQLIVTMGNPQRTHEYWHKGIFEGTVTPGMSEAIRFFRRTFRLPRVDVENDGREGFTKRHLRHEEEVILFDGTPAEVKRVPWGLMSIKVYVHHRGGKERGIINMDTDRIHSPRSRLVAVNPVKVKIGDNYFRPFGAAMVYEEDPP